MIKYIFFSCILFGSFLVKSQTPYLQNETYTYSELIESYQSLTNNSPIVKLKEIGKSDLGKPIHLVIIDKHQDFDPEKIKSKNKSIVFINNGIHAGEVCGIDASVELAKKIINPRHELYKALDSVVVLIIPVYNVGGMLNRGSFSRANQNGPKEHGFRGNAKNLDLNRDFIKVDSKNAETFTKVFRKWDPDIFIDTHTTNGSDHQYTLTLIATQKDKQNPILSEYAQQKMIPEFYKGMSDKYMDMIPYVYSIKSSPDKGIKDFMETARYSSGYAALFDCYSFITEAHVFKTFEARVKHTIGFLETVVGYAALNNSEILNSRKKAKNYTKQLKYFTVAWELDTSKYVEIPFNGYKTKVISSEVTGLDLKVYDANKPFSKNIKYYKTYSPATEITKPKFYVIPQAYSTVIERLNWNQISYTKLENDTSIEVRAYYIKEYDSPKTPYEGHFLHTKVRVDESVENINFYKGDLLIPTNQEGNKYIVETLEPLSVESFFTWNFFDGILQQKEWFSDYVFEPIAKKILAENEELNEEFEQKKIMDYDFANNSWAQLYYIYKNSPYYEKTVNRYPIYRIE